jgi:hypothetical protein
MGDENKHLLFPMPLPKSQFDSIHTGRADPSRYLIIGFDTEYQRYADEDTQTLNNEVLSYQYSPFQDYGTQSTLLVSGASRTRCHRSWPRKVPLLTVRSACSHPRPAVCSARCQQKYRCSNFLRVLLTCDALRGCGTLSSSILQGRQA